ncbi:MAG TPA: hypothetical protein VN281_11965 [Verrucomicrobiae bacterium]|jgi:hypothetical protein|nr:hypothetical protein [Verrucomicrobiae bacterium]
MKRNPILLVAITLLAGNFSLQAQFTNADWPSTINTNSAVDFAIFDTSASFPSTPAGWLASLSLSGGGDQAFSLVTLDSLKGDEGTSSFMNVADANYAQFGTIPNVDILLQVFGDNTLYNANGSGKTITFREGILGTELPVSAGTIPLGANNGHWNWMLFSVTNPVSPNTQNTGGLRYIGFQSSPAGPGTQNGGVNGGTLRIEGLPGLAIRAAAIGPAGAFGTSNVINAVFYPPAPCDPEPAVNLAFIDINANITNHLVVLNDTDQTVAYSNNVGPAGDLRTAVQATSSHMNFGIVSNYLGEPCNPPRPMKVCVEFYDDPSLAGVSFGPDTYAADAVGDTATYAGPAYVLTGTGQWLKLAFVIPSVNLAGVNTGSLTGGPRLVFNGGSPFIDRIELGVFRTGTNALAGLDPEPSYHLNPLICTTNYGYYLELDLQNGVTNGLTPGSSGGDQNMVIELAGPTNDLRLSEAPTGGNNNLQFAIIPSNAVPPLGPTYQDNADVLMALTYYDDPAMVGARLYPWPYSTLKNGSTGITFPNQLSGTNVFGTPYSYRATLTGSGTWKVAYFELPNVNLAGVNQGPQSVARFQTDPATNGVPASGYIHVTRVRYCVARPCGSLEGINAFQTLYVANPQPFAVGWHGSATVQSAPVVNGGTWSNVFSITNLLTNTNTYAPPGSGSEGFFRLVFPHSPLP